MRLRRVFAGVLVVAVLMAAQAIADESPHWNKATCDTCHTGASPTAATLRHATLEQGCSECHGERGGATPCRHRSDLPPGDMPVPDYYRAELRDGKITCGTCHDVTFQCNNPNIAYSLQNPRFSPQQGVARFG